MTQNDCGNREKDLVGRTEWTVATQVGIVFFQVIYRQQNTTGKM